MTYFGINSLPNLDEVVISTLQFFIKTRPPKLDLGDYKRPLVVGSGNAAVTGRIMFEGKDAVFADESTYISKLDAIKDIDGCILISASGGKHAPIIAKEMRKRKIETRLLTNSPNAPAKEFIDNDKFFVFPKQREPYTYNTSTYMGMILAKTKENPKEILEFINKKISPIVPKNFRKFKAFFIIVPNEFDSAREMFLTKFDELFGPMVRAAIYTPEQAKHAKTITPSEKEVFISFGYDSLMFGNHENPPEVSYSALKGGVWSDTSFDRRIFRMPKTAYLQPKGLSFAVFVHKNQRLNVPLPTNVDYASLIAIGYYIIGKIQVQHPPYFKQNIERYCKEASKMFGQEIKPIVE